MAGLIRRVAMRQRSCPIRSCAWPQRRSPRLG